MDFSFQPSWLIRYRELTKGYPQKDLDKKILFMLMNQVADKGTYLPSYIYCNNAFAITQTQTCLSLSVSYWFFKADWEWCREWERSRGGEEKNKLSEYSCLKIVSFLALLLNSMTGTARQRCKDTLANPLVLEKHWKTKVEYQNAYCSLSNRKT